jgi:hypothetical protein
MGLLEPGASVFVAPLGAGFGGGAEPLGLVLFDEEEPEDGGGVVP